MLLREVRDIYRKELGGTHPPGEVDALFYRLLEHYLDLPRFVLGLEPGKMLTREEEAPLFNALSQLTAGQPVQYITGTARFLDMDLRVGPGALIPRPETEELVRWVLERHAADLREGNILDIGTGSGCIALGLAKSLSAARVTALDISGEALEVARENARHLGLDVRLVRADILTPEGEWPENILNPEGEWPGYDLIISNPPYIPRGQEGQLAVHVRDHEPREALFAPDSDPLLYYRHIAGFSRRHLRGGGWLYVEIHEDFGAPTAELFREAGLLEVSLKKDIFGKDRFLCGRSPDTNHKARQNP
ncbi:MULTISPECIES: peptide chain release factor N(5)-glutamine methyltransferase [unclassified Robiginitalea]|uniref:peptide chain release factor N(5)-glutamine methyltransferase n=1 Tax=Robiginitalea TaxID=252306 RepID=UPI00234AEF08|nr:MULTISPECIES: peptide chain release factor N(5)-glutamine methyltransferase [unclassified Robiginitalea]MDC6354282.1 peptide chain release factor N(5)-glutamine methyltransferase [Robiginitalea sp. PM2]MDC6374549.1 peptide chain release factor N(5)-glutamine methyltransferase [Robiginitalea sp. SP8]